MYGSSPGAVENLNNKLFRLSKLVARLELRPAESGVGILLSRKVKISWYAPGNARVGPFTPPYLPRKDAQKELDGTIFGGRHISVSFQTPGFRQKTSFSIEIKGLIA